MNPLEFIRPESPDLDRALRAVGLAESATAFASGHVNRQRARVAVEAARRRLIDLRSKAVTPAAGHNTSTARLDKLEERLAQAEASLKETPAPEPTPEAARNSERVTEANARTATSPSP